MEDKRKSRADYFKERRKSTKTFYAEISIDKMEKLEKILKNKNINKRIWLEDKIDKEKE